DLGNLELIRLAGRTLDRPDLRVATDLAARIVADVGAGPQCGLPGNVESPGLMTGLAGIGYGMLRLADPDQVPCLLLLESLYSRSVPL
ncbi:MAG: hypothetical protein GXO96_09285, partial [Nitrospirae bacterium]|nr:hypothetical protein [Candidatus Manganitrophaceae bacterium]